MSEVKDKLITAENLKNAYDDNKRAISELKSDITSLLEEYFELYPQSVKVRLQPSEYGLDILIDATAVRVKDFGNFGE